MDISQPRPAPDRHGIQGPNGVGAVEAPHHRGRAKTPAGGDLRRLVDLLMTSPPLQRPALSRQLGLPRHSVSDLLAMLESRGYVHVSGARDGVPGRSQLSYTLRADAALALGFDVGGTKVSGAVCDMAGTVLAEETTATSADEFAALVAQLTSMADRLCAAASVPRYLVRHTMIGVPAVVDPAGGVLSLADNLPGISGIDPREPLSAALGGQVALDNDVNLALVAEITHNRAAASANMAFVALGTGIGGALMIDGHLLRGAHGGAGEIGYLPLRSLDASRRPQLETEAGEAGIRRLYVAAGGDKAHSVEQIFAAAAQGNAAALGALDRAADAVARGIVSLLALVDVDTVVLGGSIGSRTEFIERVTSLVGAGWPQPVVLRRSAAGGRAGLLGSVELARQRLLTELFGAA